MVTDTQMERIINMKKVKLPQDLGMMIKIKNHQQSIDR